MVVMASIWCIHANHGQSTGALASPDRCEEYLVTTQKEGEMNDREAGMYTNTKASLMYEKKWYHIGKTPTRRFGD